MATDITKWLIAAFVSVTLVVSSFLIGFGRGQNCSVIEDSVKVDTLVICDTIVQEKPIYVDRMVIEKVLVHATDTLWQHDTLYVLMDREQIVWQDSMSRVYASGVQTQIDSVHHYVKERVVTREVTHVVKKPCRWGVGVQMGYGMQVGQQVSVSPYIGVGLTYNIISW